MLIRLPRTQICDGTTGSPISCDIDTDRATREMVPNTEGAAVDVSNKDVARRKRPKFLRCDSLPYVMDSIDLETRQRSNSLPHTIDWSLIHEKTSETSADTNTTPAASDDRRLFAIMINIAHIIFGIAILQLGIVGTWYKRYMNFQQDQLRHVIYVCTIFIIEGTYGALIAGKRLVTVKAHRVVYRTLTAFSVVAGSVILAYGIRVILAETYQRNETVVIVFDSLLLGLAVVEIPAALLSAYLTSPQNEMRRNLSTTTLSSSQSDNQQEAQKSPPSWASTFGVILNVAHIVIGLCVLELSLIGMMYRRFMNIDNAALVAVVVVSASFVLVGTMGTYNQLTGRFRLTCNRSIYTIATLTAVGGAAMVLSIISMAMTSNQYYAGIEAIVAFDAMILSMSGIELLVGITTIALVLVPLFVTKSKESDSRPTRQTCNSILSQ